MDQSAARDEISFNGHCCWSFQQPFQSVRRHPPSKCPRESPALSPSRGPHVISASQPRPLIHSQTVSVWNINYVVTLAMAFLESMLLFLKKCLRRKRKECLFFSGQQCASCRLELLLLSCEQLATDERVGSRRNLDP